MRLAETGHGSQSLVDRIAQLDVERRDLQLRLKAVSDTAEARVALPDRAWVQRQLEDIAMLISSNGSGVSAARGLLSDVVASEVKAPGRKRGRAQLRCRLLLDDVLFGGGDRNPPPSVQQLLGAPLKAAAEGLPELAIDLGRPNRMDTLAPQIVAWRRAGVKRKEIADRTGLRIANAWLAAKRYDAAAATAA